MSNPKPQYKLAICWWPLFPTFVNEPSTTGYECQKRDTSPKEGFSYMGFLLYTRSPILPLPC
jgi:hypothetical protein